MTGSSAPPTIRLDRIGKVFHGGQVEAHTLAAANAGIGPGEHAAVHSSKRFEGRVPAGAGGRRPARGGRP
jgi:hypothetical protein